MPIIEDYKNYIISNRTALNSSDIARYIKMDATSFSRALSGKKDCRGREIKIPKRCLPLLEKYFESIGVKIK